MGAAAGNFMGSLMGQLQPTIDRREADRQAEKQNMRDILLRGMNTDPAQNDGEADADYANRKQAYHQQLLDEYNKTLHHTHAKELVQKAGQALGLYHKMGAPQGGGPLAAPVAKDDGGAAEEQGLPVNGLTAPGAGAAPGVAAARVSSGGATMGQAPNTPSPAATLPPPKFNYGAQGAINNQAPAVNAITNAQISQTARKKEAATIGLKPGTREYNQYVLLGTMPNVLRPTTAASKHAQLVESFMDANPGMTEADAEHLAGQREIQQKQTPVEIETTDGQKVPALQSAAGGFTHLDGSAFDASSIAHIVRPSNAAIRVNAQEAITLSQAEALEKSGAKLNIVDASGQPLNREDIPPGMVLQAVHSGQNTVYTPRGINDKVVTVNNQRVAVNPMEVQQIPQGAGTVLGQANTGTSTASTPTVVQRDAQGVPHVLGSTSTRSPNTPSVRNPLIPTDVTPAAGASPRSVAPATAAPAARGARTAGGVLPGMDSAAVQVARPLNEASTQLFGDIKHPEFKSLSSYEKLADDPEARKRIGQALQLTFAGIEKAAGGAGASVSGGVGPVSVSTGGLGTWLQNALGVPQANAEMAQKIREDAIKDLKPEEREAVNAIVDAFSAIPAIRSVTKGVASQASIEALERDVPAIGWNTMDSKTFRDKMARLGEYFYQGKKFLPGENYVDTSNIDAYLGRGKSKPSPRGALSGPKPKTAEEYLKSMGR